ncbi:MAG: STAS domain-containing protein [Ruminiclostridium sp.]|nr:STAS domain-containing protein [Ruminiclostridium sp.]
MKIEGKVKKNVLHIKVDGRIDLDTSTELEAYLKDNIEGVGSVEIDFKNVEYISSAGLRVLLWLKKQNVEKEDFVVVRHMNDTVRSVFELTGFSDLIVIR